MSNHILVVGSGVRETIIVKKLINDSDLYNSNPFSSKKIKIICLGNNKNPYLSENTELHIVNSYTVNSLLILLGKVEKIDYGIIGPEAPLELGYADILESKGIPCIGPLASYAKIETSKIDARKFIDECGLGEYSPMHEMVERDNLSLEKINKKYRKIVIKKDGLCGGKGVKVEGIDFERKEELLLEIAKSEKGERILIEEKIEGEEYSLMTISDGNGGVGHFPPIQDNKRLNENDKGPNTGGMGCIIDKENILPFLNEYDVKLSEEINKRIIEELNSNGRKEGEKIGYRGILYGSYIKTKEGKIYIIEFNARFGDPECYLGLSLLKTNFYKVCNELVSGELKSKLEFDKSAMIGVYMVPENYPNGSKDKYDIYIKKEVEEDIVYGQVEREGDHLYSMSSRTLIIGTKGETLYDCYKKIYNKIKLINGKLYYRKDIGSKYLTDYEQSGVSIEKGNESLKEIKKYIEGTYNENVLGRFGDFGGQFKLGEYNLVSSIDGVGTKSILVSKYLGEEGFVGLGRDIVNHSVNDILVQGAYPLFFLDYFGTSNIKKGEIKNFIKGASEACIENGRFPIIGGETAEMPSIYLENKTDLVGCIVGIKDSKLLENTEINKGDIVIGFASDSPHTNGYSLINKIIEETGMPEKEILDVMIKPHKSYLKEIRHIIDNYGYKSVKGMCHVTGGGLEENMSRILGDENKIEYEDLGEMPEWCKYIMEKGDINEEEMRKVYNCGIGFVVIIPEECYKKMEEDRSLNYIKMGFVKEGKVLINKERNEEEGLEDKESEIGIIMGSESDLSTMEDACKMLDFFNVKYECTIVSAHRTPDRMYKYAKEAKGRGIKVIIAGAGGAAHLPGMVASMTTLPVIGVPVKSSTLSGQDSLLSIVQMPRGVPVATVGIGNATNAGLLALRIIGRGDQMEKYLKIKEEEVLEKAKILENVGYKKYKI